MLKIEKGIKVDGGYDKDGYTCLHLAASRGHINLVEILLEKGANPAKKSRNFRKDTPFEVAMRKGKDETAELLVKIMSIKR